MITSGSVCALLKRSNPVPVCVQWNSPLPRARDKNVTVLFPIIGDQDARPRSSGIAALESRIQEQSTDFTQSRNGCAESREVISSLRMISCLPGVQLRFFRLGKNLEV